MAFSSEVKKTRQNKNLELRFCFNQNRTRGARLGAAQAIARRRAVRCHFNGE
jgi:hypothetical protein